MACCFFDTPHVDIPLEMQKVEGRFGKVKCYVGEIRRERELFVMSTARRLTRPENAGVKERSMGREFIQ